VQIVLKSEDIHCASCAESVKKALTALEGVEKVEVDLEKKTVTVNFGPPLQEERIKSAMEEAGFAHMPA